MWYLAWFLGLGLASLFAIFNGVRLERDESAAR